MKDLLRKIVDVGWSKMDIKDSFNCFWKGVYRSVHICYRKIWFVEKKDSVVKKGLEVLFVSEFEKIEFISVQMTKNWKTTSYWMLWFQT